MLNVVVLQGRIPFDLELKNGDDEKKAFLGFNISVRRNYKPEGEQYYPEDLIYCKAFNHNAINIHKYFQKGDQIIIQGELRRDDDYEDKNGNLKKGQMHVYITGFQLLPKANNNDNAENNETEEKSQTKSKISPLLAKKPATTTTKTVNPLARSRAII